MATLLVIAILYAIILLCVNVRDYFVLRRSETPSRKINSLSVILDIIYLGLLIALISMGSFVINDLKKNAHEANTQALDVVNTSYCIKDERDTLLSYEH